ncbi:MAG TPA: YbaK/EbsC family protein, partial [Leptolinea sp.]
MPILLLEIPILEFLDKLHIRYERFEHPPVATVKEAEQYSELHPGAHCRNLFLRDKKGIQHFLVVLKIETPINLAELAKQLKCGRLSFASD